MSKYPFQVKVPADGPLTREQGWAALDDLRSRMTHILSRMNAEKTYVGGLKYKPSEGCVLPEEELDEALNVRARLARLIKSMGKDVLDRLADVTDEDDDPYNLKKYPTEIRELLDNNTGDLYRFSREKGGSYTMLAFALLEQEDWTPEEIGELIEKKLSPNYKHGQWWTCPLCDENEPGYIDHETCRTCYGYGYVCAEKRPDYDSYPQSMAGRKAVNNGEAWSEEQEKLAYAEENE